MPLNIEFKAPVAHAERLDELEARLLGTGPRFAGEDHQVDTYFRVPHGRLKLREGTVEHALIHYRRSAEEGARASEVLLYEPLPDPALKAVLTAALGVLTVVDKMRRIYFSDNVKIHFDRVAGLGTFLEVEAIDRDGTIGEEKLQAQCAHFIRFFGVQAFQPLSYSDLLLREQVAQDFER